MFIKRVKDNLFIFIVGFFYYFSFSGINMGDGFFMGMENGYPLFITNTFSGFEIWHGFRITHLLNIPTLRFIQIVIAKIGLLPNPLLLIQLVNLVLAVCTLKLIHSLLRRMEIANSIALVTTLLFAFSFGFYAYMNGELHHFGIFLIAAALRLLFEIERSQTIKKSSVFMFCACIALAPLYHIETIIYSAIIILYVLFKNGLRVKFISEYHFVILGIIIFPFILVILSFVFHFFELGKPPIIKYMLDLPQHIAVTTYKDLAVVVYGKLNIHSIYTMLRSHLQSFSIICTCAKIIQKYNDVVFYSNAIIVNITVAIIILYYLMFTLVNIILATYLIRNRHKIGAFIKLLLSMIIIHLIGYGIFLSNYGLLCEFYIISVMIHCILLGYVFNEKRKYSRVLYYLLIILTIVSNVFIFVYPQKISAQTINKIFDELESQNKDEINIIRVSFFLLPYDVRNRSKFLVHSDEHAYDSQSNVLGHINNLNKMFNAGKKIYLICPVFLIGESKEVNFDSVLVMGVMGANPTIANNLKYFLSYIKDNYKTAIITKYPYNFAFTGQLGELAVVELKARK